MGFLEHVGVSADEGTTTAKTDQTSENASGGVHGGLLATMLDSAMGSACRDELDDPDATVVTVQLSVTYLNGAEPGDELRADATVKKATKSLCLVDGEVRRVGDDERRPAAGRRWAAPCRPPGPPCRRGSGSRP